jgi:amino-acid N-acetyltransferase
MPSPRERAIKPTDLRGILRYVPMFRDHVFVIAVDGAVVSHENFVNLVTDIAVLRSLAIKVVLVHGIGHQLAELAAGHRITPSDAHGEGPTDAPTMALAREAAALVSQTVLEHLSQAGLRCAITNAVRATRVGLIKGRDHVFTGKVEKVDTALLTSMLGQDILPLVTPILCDREGQSLRVNSDHLAAELAVALGASKLIYLTPHAGLTVGGEVKVNLPEDELAALLADRRSGIEPRLRSKAQQAAFALDEGVPRAHILDGRVFGGLLIEIFDKVGLGTMVHANDYDRIRPARKKDAQSLYNLARHGARADALVARSRQQIEQSIADFVVYEIDDSIIGCAALRRFDSQPALMEIGAVYVQPFYHGRGVGTKLVEFLKRKAKQAGARKLVALTTQTQGFFTGSCGFEEGSVADLPAQRRRELKASGRNSRVLTFPLARFSGSPR